MKKFKSLGISALFGITAFGGHVVYKTKKNQDLLEEIQNSEKFMDATRPSNESFGINWGFKADSMVSQSFEHQFKRAQPILKIQISPYIFLKKNFVKDF